MRQLYTENTNWCASLHENVFISEIASANAALIDGKVKARFYVLQESNTQIAKPRQNFDQVDRLIKLFRLIDGK